MAKPIAKTPVFEGEDAIAVLKEMQDEVGANFQHRSIVPNDRACRKLAQVE